VAVLQASSTSVNTQTLVVLLHGTALVLLLVVTAPVALPGPQHHPHTMLQAAVLQVRTDAQQRRPCTTSTCVAFHEVLTFASA
jgi:hypothetical protein